MSWPWSLRRAAASCLGRWAAPALADEAGPSIDDRFVSLVEAQRPRSVLEVGTLQSVPGRSTHHRALFPWVSRDAYVMADVQPGLDVDVVADLHALPADWAGRFGAVIAVAVFEHLERPWIAAREIERVLAPGGLFLVVTHQTFPLHGYPRDFFRFSKEALALLFADAGLPETEARYSQRCWVVPPASIVPASMLAAWNGSHPSFVIVAAVGRKAS